MKKITAICALSALTACGPSAGTNTAPSETPAPNVAHASITQGSNPTGAAQIITYRTSVFGLINQPKVFVDDQQAGNCSPGKFHTTTVTPGNHVIRARTLSETTLNVQVAPGETVYVRCSMSVGLLAGNVKFTLVTASEGASKVAGMR